MSARLASPKLGSRRGHAADGSISLAGFASSRRRPREGGFTLVEVVLAIGLAIVILVVAMSFYHQATNLRGQLIEASERVSTIRLLMDRLASDLRAARSHDWEGFNGDATSLRFVKCEAIASSMWTRNQPVTDLRLVTYGVSTGLDGTNKTVNGFTRTERAALETREPRGGASSSTVSAAVSTNVAPVEPLTDVIRFVHFRYWDGTTWVESWGDVVPPLAVEVSFGFDPQPDDALPDEYPFEVFRRIVALPGGRESDPFAELFAIESSGTKSKSTEGAP